MVDVDRLGLDELPERDKRPLGGGRVSPDSLFPTAPRAKETILRFKKVIAAHLQEVEGKTTEAFLDDLSLELWRITAQTPYP